MRERHVIRLLLHDLCRHQAGLFIQGIHGRSELGMPVPVQPEAAAAGAHRRRHVLGRLVAGEEARMGCNAEARREEEAGELLL